MPKSDASSLVLQDPRIGRFFQDHFVLLFLPAYLNNAGRNVPH